MASGKIFAICQSGGKFVTAKDGIMSYAGGEAHAIDIDREMTLSSLKTEMANMFNLKDDTFFIKYFLRSNRRTLITVSSDKDLQRMVDFHADLPTTDVYIIKKDEIRITKSVVVAEPRTPTDATPDDAKRLKLSNDWDSIITGKGQAFDSAKAFRDALHKYAIGNSFMYKFKKNEGSRVTAECTDEDCQWRIYAARSPKNQEFVIKKMSDTHTCVRNLSNEGHRLASQGWVAGVIKDKLRDSPNYKPREIADDLHRDYGLSLNYAQAWRGKFVAQKELHNSREEACNQLPSFCDRITETNPGSTAILLPPDESRFGLFIAFHASLSGFEHGCRPLLFLDGISLKSNKKWKLLAAIAVDGENDIFPVAFSVVEAETNDNWNWFLVQLKSALSVSRTMTFISNGKYGLEELVPQVFESSHHGYCVQHLIEDFKSEFEESCTQEVKDALVDNLRRAISACTEEEFSECVDSIKIESKELAEWVLLSKPERWSDAFFKGLRYGHYSSNASETFNNWISTRHEPSVLQMVDMIRCKLMEIIYARRESSNIWAETLTPSMNRRVQEEINKSHGLDVTCSTDSVFEVRDSSVYVVNIQNWECTCRRWQVTGLPCVHAVAVLEQINGCIYDYCSKYFTTECYRVAYSLSINPIPDAGNAVDSPRASRLRGRPKKYPCKYAILQGVSQSTKLFVIPRSKEDARKKLKAWLTSSLKIMVQQRQISRNNAEEVMHAGVWSPTHVYMYCRKGAEKQRSRTHVRMPITQVCSQETCAVCTCVIGVLVLQVDCARA